MLLHVPVSLDGLLALFASCFTQPTFQTFRGLVVGQVSQIGPRTVCGMLVGARLSGVWDHSRAHRFFSQARWQPDRLGLLLATVILGRLLDADAPILVAIDDSLLQRWGRRIYGCFYHHDATANSDKGAVAWGNNWVVAGIVVGLPILARPVCLPVLFRLWKPKRKHIPKRQDDPERPSKPRLAREMIDLLAAHFPARQVHAVGDAGYASAPGAVCPRGSRSPSACARTARCMSPRRPRRLPVSANAGARRRRATSWRVSRRSRPTPPPPGGRSPPTATASPLSSPCTYGRACGIERSATPPSGCCSSKTLTSHRAISSR